MKPTANLLRSYIIAISSILVLNTIIYFNSLDNRFVWDDKALIVQNNSLKDIKNIPRFFSSDFRLPSLKQAYYRPLVITSFMIDYHLWHLNPLGYHLTNLIFHILTTILVYHFSMILLKDHNFSLLASLLFASHPVHSEAVTFISARTDILCTFFYLLTFLSFIKFVQGTPFSSLYLFVSSLCFLLALLAKEMAISLPLMVFFYELLFLENIKNRRPFSFWAPYSPFLVVIIIYFSLRAYALGHLSPVGLDLNGLPLRMLIFGQIIIDYVRLLLLPFSLNPYYPTHHDNSLNIGYASLSLILLGIILFLMIKIWRSQRLAFFASAWFFITLLPVSNIVPLPAGLKAERFLYLPSLGFCLTFALISRSLWYWLKRPGSLSCSYYRGAYIFVLIIILISYSLDTIKANTVWQDDYTIFSYMVKRAPGLPIAHFNLAKALEEKGMFDEAIKEYQEAIRIDPEYAKAHNNLGILYAKKDLLDKAIKEFRQAIQINTHDPSFHLNLAKAFKIKGFFALAIREYREALKLDPQSAQAHNGLALIYIKIKERDKARYHLSQSIKLDPHQKDVPAIIATIKEMNEIP